MAMQLSNLENQFAELHKKSKEFLPKVDVTLIHDLLLRRTEDAQTRPPYLIEVFTKPDTDIEEMRNVIWGATGVVPGSFENGTHHAVSRPLSVESLGSISQYNSVVKITGVFIGRNQLTNAGFSDRPVERNRGEASLGVQEVLE